MSFASIYGPTSSAHLGANQLAAQDTTHEVLSGFQLEEGHSPLFSLSLSLSLSRSLALSQEAFVMGNA